MIFFSEWCNGIPKFSDQWEKWTEGKVYEWRENCWSYLYDVDVDVASNFSRIKKPEEITMNNSLEQNIQRMKKELADMEAKLKANEKWEPKSGPWVVNVRGEVMRDNIVEGRSPFGMTFQTEEQAEIASKLMRERNRIIQYVLEHEPDCKFEFVVGQNNYYVYYNPYISKWRCGSACAQGSQNIYMPEWVADKLVDDLNSGRVVL